MRRKNNDPNRNTSEVKHVCPFEEGRFCPDVPLSRKDSRRSDLTKQKTSQQNTDKGKPNDKTQTIAIELPLTMNESVRNEESFASIPNEFQEKPKLPSSAWCVARNQNKTSKDQSMPNLDELKVYAEKIKNMNFENIQIKSKRKKPSGKKDPNENIFRETGKSVRTKICQININNEDKQDESHSQNKSLCLSNNSARDIFEKPTNNGITEFAGVLKESSQENLDDLIKEPTIGSVNLASSTICGLPQSKENNSQQESVLRDENQQPDQKGTVNQKSESITSIARESATETIQSAERQNLEKAKKSIDP